MQTPYQEFGKLRPSRKIVAKMLEGKEFDSVLEVGAQWGENLVAIREKFPDKKIVGVDIDWDGIIDEAKVKTQLDLRIGDVFNLDFEKDEFDVVFTNALFCMLKPEEVIRGLGEIIRVAKKSIILVELEVTARTGLIRGRRTGANWTELLEEYGLKTTKHKITEDLWDVHPWIDCGYIYDATKN